MDLAQLTNNTPAAPNLTTAATQQTLPDWYTSFLENLSTRGTQIAGQPHAPYEGPRVAGFSPMQQQAFGQVQGAASSAQPGLLQVQQYLAGLGPQVQSMLGAGAAASGQGTEIAANAGAQAQGALGQFGSGSVDAATTASQQANAGLAGPTPTFPGQMTEYMSPYTSSVVNEIGRLGNRNFTENIMPGVADSFVASGQSGSSRHADMLGRAMRDAQADISGKQAMALESGYRTAADIFGADANRGLQRDTVRASTALQGGQLTSGALGQMAQLGSNTALGTGRLGVDSANSSAATTNQGASILGNFGIGSANAQGSIASQMQQLGLGGANALYTMGAAQQGQQQQGLDTAYQDYLRSQSYDMNQLTQLRGLMSGLQLPTGGTSVQSSPGTDTGASPLAWLATLLQQNRP